MLTRPGIGLMLAQGAALRQAPRGVHRCHRARSASRVWPAPRRLSRSLALFPSWAWPSVELERDRIAVGIDESVDAFVVSPAARAPHVSGRSVVPLPRSPPSPLYDVGRVPMNADRGGVDHLQIATVSLRDRLEDPDPRHPPCAIAQSGCSRSSADHSAPECPPRANPSAAASKCRSTQADHPVLRGTPRGLFGSSGADDRPFKIRQLVPAWGHGRSCAEL